MRPLRSYWFFALAVLALVVLIAAVRPGCDARLAYACTGGPGPFHETAVNSDIVVVAQATEVGGPENTAPTVTPMPTPDWGGQTPPTTSYGVDLQGIGAELQVLQAIGNVPVKIDVDTETRERVEETLRRAEANPHTILPCLPDFGVERYAEGKTYLLFLNRDGDGGWFTFLQWEIEGADVLTGGSTYEGGRLALAVTKPVLDAYFADLPATTFNPNDPEALWVIEQERIPTEKVLAAILALRSGAHPTPTPPPGNPPELPTLAEMACQPSLLQASAGDKIVLGNLAVTLPASGQYAYGPLVMDPGGVALRICHVETQSVITLSDATGEEISRAGTAPFGLQVLDQIAASAQPASTVGRIAPPDVGDAGLR